MALGDDMHPHPFDAEGRAFLHVREGASELTDPASGINLLSQASTAASSRASCRRSFSKRALA